MSGQAGAEDRRINPAGAQLQIYFRVPDVDAAAERITANGGKILNGPMEVPDGGRIVNAMDPQGVAFGLHSKKAS